MLLDEPGTLNGLPYRQVSITGSVGEDESCGRWALCHRLCGSCNSSAYNICLDETRELGECVVEMRPSYQDKCPSFEIQMPGRFEAGFLHFCTTDRKDTAGVLGPSDFNS